MRRLAAPILVAGALAACGSAGASTRLAITVWPQGRSGPAEHYRLRCGPARGTVPDPAGACKTLARLRAPFAPVPAGAVCTQIALGPQEALVRGVVRGRRVWARLRVRNGCEIARWQRVKTVVPGFGGS